MLPTLFGHVVSAMNLLTIKFYDLLSTEEAVINFILKVWDS